MYFAGISVLPIFFFSLNRKRRLLPQSESLPAEREDSGHLPEVDIWEYLLIKSEYRISKSETNSNALNIDDQNKKIIIKSFPRVVYGYTFGTPLILNIGNSDFGIVSYFEFRASNFLGIPAFS